MARRRNAVRDALVQEARRRQKAANDKAYRLRNRGVNVGGDSGVTDPRRNFREVRDMNSRQLRSYISKLNGFVSRENGFVPGYRGAAMGRNTWAEYKRLERQYNRVARQYEAQYGNVEVPGLGVNLEQAIRDRGSRAGGARRTFEEYNREARNITGEQSLKELIADMRKKLDPNYLKERMAGVRENIQKMTEETGDNVVQRRIDELSDNQLAFLVDYTGFMNALGGRYDYQKAMNVSEQRDPENWMDNVYEDRAGVILEAIYSIRRQIPANGLTNRASKSREYTDTNVSSIPIQFDQRNTNAGPISTQKPRKRRK